jgi:hypothetical protein
MVTRKHEITKEALHHLFAAVASTMAVREGWAHAVTRDIHLHLDRIKATIEQGIRMQIRDAMGEAGTVKVFVPRSVTKAVRVIIEAPEIEDLDLDLILDEEVLMRRCVSLVMITPAPQRWRYRRA